MGEKSGAESDAKATADDLRGFSLEDQVGFLLRKAHQRSSLFFSDLVPSDLTPTQFSILFRLAEQGPMSQNSLGRSVAMDGATTKGVVDRLVGRGLLVTERDPSDRRRHIVSLTPDGLTILDQSIDRVREVSQATLAPLKPADRRTLLRLLRRLA
ncbi:MarR family winged helix-turn-helix transcriptional regulator [Marinibacterium profundimaris]|uniref:MarR family winged helix-turn-helix transcriptional regulator n=1 Tax=Marinibacterium profundimaris TaxID=1679460 RepID=UPI001E49EDFF|nr:MarR family transcriptional regulator [Marinibacterium profundimaris]